jgi:zinc transporter ZupT
LLSIWFAIHNVTEGFAISSPLLAVKLARTLPNGEQAIAITSRGLVTKLLILGLIAGGPTAVGALILSSAPLNELIIDVAMTSAAASIIYSVFNMNLSAMGHLKGDPVRFWFSIFLGFLIAIAVETALATMNHSNAEPNHSLAVALLVLSLLSIYARIRRVAINATLVVTAYIVYSPTTCPP